MATSELSGYDLLRVLGALNHPHRLRILATLAGGRNYVSRLARELSMNRPLLHMHLQRLEAAGLVVSALELSDDGHAMRYFEVVPFAFELTPQHISSALIIWQLATTVRAKSLLAREHAYRELAEGAANAQAKTAEALNQLQLRMAAVEKLLRDVG
ncbi:MAG TPA: ArsR family transcriptional regulator [Candidatus Limnocylindrales bacterium]